MTDALQQVRTRHDITLQAQRSGGGTDVIHISRIDLETLWRWLAKGLSDLAAMPHISLGYGAVFAAIAIGLWLGLGNSDGNRSCWRWLAASCLSDRFWLSGFMKPAGSARLA